MPRPRPSVAATMIEVLDMLALFILIRLCVLDQFGVVYSMDELWTLLLDKKLTNQFATLDCERIFIQSDF